MNGRIALGQRLSPNHPGATTMVVRGHERDRFPAVFLDAPTERLSFLLGGGYIRGCLAKIHFAHQLTTVVLFEVLPRNGRDLFSPIGFFRDTERDPCGRAL